MKALRLAPENHSIWESFSNRRCLINLLILMKNIFRICLFCFFTFSILLSCIKEESLENGLVGRGFLQSEVSGECLNKFVAGNYLVNQSLTDSNFIEVEVDVTTVGKFTITTDAVNGFTFGGSGEFTSTGINVVKLKGSGKPLTEGDYSFIVKMDSSECIIDIPVLASGSSGTSAVFTLSGSPDTCTQVIISGNYTKGIPLTVLNKVALVVNVSTPGKYTIATNTVNGYGFSGTGNFSTTGIQPVVLNATGTPLASGKNMFSVAMGGNTCSFTINVP